MDHREPSRPSRYRGFALFLALCYGVLAGGSLSPAPVDAQPTSISSLSKRAVLAAIGKDRGATVKSQRASPDPGILPQTPRQIWSRTFLAVGQQAAALPKLAAATSAAPYHARAPPAA